MGSGKLVSSFNFFDTPLIIQVGKARTIVTPPVTGAEDMAVTDISRSAKVFYHVYYQDNNNIMIRNDKK